MCCFLLHTGSIAYLLPTSFFTIMLHGFKTVCLFCFDKQCPIFFCQSEVVGYTGKTFELFYAVSDILLHTVVPRQYRVADIANNYYVAITRINNYKSLKKA